MTNDTNAPLRDSGTTPPVSSDAPGDEDSAPRNRDVLRAILDAVSEAVVVCDMQGKMTQLNYAVREIGQALHVDCPVEDWVNHFLFFHADAVTPLALDELPMFRVLRGEPAQKAEIVLANRAGDRRVLVVRAQALLDAGGRQAGVIVVMSDVTDRRRLEEQVLQSQKSEAIGRLAGGIAHDFNNLLCIINGYSDLLLGNPTIDIPTRNLLGEVRKAGERAASLTQQLLAYSRKQMLTPKVLDLQVIVRDTEKMLRRMIGEDIALITRHPPDLGKVKADPGQIQQVIMNLAVNARDAMPLGGKLLLTTENVEMDATFPEILPGSYVRLSVRDTGTGMSPEVRKHVFEPFFTTKGVGQGTGLGLATVYGIVKQCDGHIDVETQQGVGTAFHILLPRVEEPEFRPASHPGIAAPGGVETILIVEDDQSVRDLACKILAGKGYRVLEAGSAREAAEFCRAYKDPIHLLLTDVIMPEAGGREVAMLLMSLHPEMKLLYMSGYTDDSVVRHGLLVEQVPFLPKPFSPDSLARKVREVLDAAIDSPPG